jgi:hypothetical protein
MEGEMLSPSDDTELNSKRERLWDSGNAGWIDLKISYNSKMFLIDIPLYHAPALCLDRPASKVRVEELDKVQPDLSLFLHQRRRQHVLFI